MILPILAYGHPTLKKKSLPIDNTYPNISELVANMFETMYHARGIGLAAPQIDRLIRVIVIDIDVMKEDYPEAAGFKKVLINPEMLEESGPIWVYNEGCLSIPDIHEDVARHSNVKIRYYDENFVEHTEDFSGICARVVQHEYDHLEGKVFTDRLSALRRTLLKRRLADVSNGKAKCSYKMRISSNKK